MDDPVSIPALLPPRYSGWALGILELMGKHVALLAAVALLLMACFGLAGLRTRPVWVSGLSVRFVGLTNNPVGQETPVRIIAAPDAVGLCALFWMANTNTDGALRFRTVGEERKTERGREPYVFTND